MVISRISQIYTNDFVTARTDNKNLDISFREIAHRLDRNCGGYTMV